MIQLMSEISKEQPEQQVDEALFILQTPVAIETWANSGEFSSI